MQIVDKSMTTIFSNKYLTAVITLFLVLYGSLATPKLPKFLTNLFDRHIFRALILTLIVYKDNRNLMMSISIAVAFLITMQIVSEQKFLENFSNKNEDKDI